VIPWEKPPTQPRTPLANKARLRTMIKFRKRIIAFAAFVIIGHLILLNYADLTWKENAGNYVGISAMILIIASMIFSIRHEKRNASTSWKDDK
jgi:hypothetical protein